MTVSIIVNKDVNSSIRDCIIKAIGFPAHYHLADEHAIFFYFKSDPDQVRYDISQYMTLVYRKNFGHGPFVQLHSKFNEAVEISFDADNTLFTKYTTWQQRQHLGIREP